VLAYVVDLAASRPDVVSVYIAPLAPALLGIVGIALGSWIAARSALRSRLIDFNVKEAEDERAFDIRAVSVITELSMASHYGIDDMLTRGTELARQHAGTDRIANAKPATVELRLDPVLMKRVHTLTNHCRETLAEAQFYTAGELAEAFYAFDARREVVVRAVNGSDGPADLRAAQRECDGFRDFYVGQIARLLQVDRMRGRARIYHLAQVRRLRRFAKSLAGALQEQMDEGGRIVRAAKLDKAQAR
jgi:hypothetical protein